MSNMEPDEISWHWTKPIPGRPEMAGDLSRLFNRGGIDPPELLQDLAMSSSAALFAREVIQNSWDAFRQMDPKTRERLDLDGLHVEFRFRELSRGAEARAVREALRLQNLSDHLASVEDGRREVDLSSDDCLNGTLDDPLTVLEVIEHGGAGMTGAWGSGQESAMARALIWVGWANRGDGAGGSFGYGKAGVAQGSRIRSVLAYSCFPEPADGETATRRLLGVTYWNRHTANEVSYTGWGLLGRKNGEHEITPYEDDAADALAEAIGMDRRSPDEAFGTGTTLLIVDPAFGSDELINAVGLNWWPALRAETGLTAEIVDEQGESWETDLSNEKSTSAFLDAHELLVASAERDEERHRIVELDAIDFEGEPIEPGRLALIADPAGWSFPSRNGAGQVQTHQSIVALTRSPQMVVSYHVFGDREPFVRGLFIASKNADGVLRRTEPAAHDDWLVRGSDPTTREHRRFARQVKDAIREAVQSFRDELAPPLSTRPAITTPVCGELLAGRTTGSNVGKKKPKPKPIERRNVAIRLVHADGVQDRPEAIIGSEPGSVRARAQVEFELLGHHSKDAAKVNLELRLHFVEDGRTGGTCDLKVESSPTGFARAGDSDVPKDVQLYSGILKKGVPVRFVVESVDYPDDSSTEFAPKAEVVA